MVLCNESCLTNQLSYMQNSNIRHYTQTFLPFVFTRAMFVGTIDSYHFIQLPIKLTLTGDHKVSAKQNSWASYSLTVFD